MCIYMCVYICVCKYIYRERQRESCSVTSCVRFFVTLPWTAACQASLSFTVSQSWLKLMSIESMMPSTHITLCRPLLLLPSVNLSQDQGLFQ